MAISSSIDSLGIGITYGLKNTKLTKIDKLILFIISIIITLCSGFIGNVLKLLLKDILLKIIGSLILIIMGLFIIIQTNNKEYSFDFDNSNDINYKEAFALGIALSLDSLCIGIGGSIVGINIWLFSILVAFLQYIFLNLGNILGNKLNRLKFVPQSVWNKISGFLLIAIGLFKTIF